MLEYKLHDVKRNEVKIFDLSNLEQFRAYCKYLDKLGGRLLVIENEQFIKYEAMDKYYDEDKRKYFKEIVWEVCESYMNRKITNESLVKALLEEREVQLNVWLELVDVDECIIQLNVLKYAGFLKVQERYDEEEEFK